MTQRDERLPALGQPAAQASAEPTPDGADDFAGEHSATTVDRAVSAGRDTDAEPESPHGWSGLDHDGAP